MAVLVTAEVPGQTEQGYDGMLAALGSRLKQAPGFVLHTAYPVEGGWRVLEVWDSKTHANEWYAKNVAPNLPPGVYPKRSVQDLHSLLRS
jgi:hypothetical protein